MALRWDIRSGMVLDVKNRDNGWVPAVIVLSLGWLLLYATRTALSSALKDIGDYWGLSQSYLGFLSSSFFVAYMVLQIPSGFLADRFGSRKVLLAGFGIQALGLFLGSLSSGPVQFLFARMLTGAGQATYFACQQAIISFTVPLERRALGTAITTGGAGIGSAVGFLLGKFLSAGGFGWKMPFAVLGALSAAFTFAVVAIVPDARAAKRSEGTSITANPSPARELGSTSDRWVFLALVSASHFLSMYGFYVMLTWMPYYLEAVRGMKGGLAAIIPVVMPLMMAPATVAGGIISDKKHSKTLVLKYAMPIAAIATALIPVMKSPAGLVFALALYGATGKLVIDPGLVSVVGENSPEASRNATLAFLNFWAACAMAVAPAVTGLIAQVTGSFDVSFYAAGLFNILGLGTFLAAMRFVNKPIPSSRSLTHC